MKILKSGIKFHMTLLAGVSASALVLSASRGVEAADGKWWFEATGQALIWSGGKTQHFLLPANVSRPKVGGGLGAEIGYQPENSPWSFAVRGKYNESNRVRNSFYNNALFTTGASVRTSEKQAVVDFEVGRDVGLGVLGVPESALKAKAGVRFAHFKGKERGTGTYSAFGTGAIRNKRSFTGVGPRLGFEAAIPISNQIALKLDGAGAILFGKRKAKFRSSVPFATGSVKRSKSAIVPNFDAFAGFSLTASSAPFEIVLGYGIDAYFNVWDSGYLTSKKTNRILHGPRLKMRIELN